MTKIDEYENDLKSRATKIEGDNPGYYNMIYFEKDGHPKFLAGSRWLRRQWEEMPSHETFGSSFHYECYIILEGDFTYGHKDVNDSNRRAYACASSKVPFDNDKKLWHFTMKQDFPMQSWMRRIDGNLRLSDLTLPASHCSFARQFALEDEDFDVTPVPDQRIQQSLLQMNTCQAYDVKEQLQRGVRILDLRCGSGGKLSKGPFLTSTHVQVVLNICESFVKDNDTETVLVRVGWSQETITLGQEGSWSERYQRQFKDQQPGFEQMMKDLLQNRKSWYTANEMPRLDNARGKCVLLRAYSAVDTSFGIDVTASIEQLDTRVTEPKDLQALVQEKFDSETSRITGDEPVFLSFSTSVEADPNTTSLWITPKLASAAMKPKLLDYPRKLDKQVRGCWIFSDYVDDQTTKAIMKLNLHGGEEI